MQVRPKVRTLAALGVAGLSMSAMTSIPVESAALVAHHSEIKKPTPSYPLPAPPVIPPPCHYLPGLGSPTALPPPQVAESAIPIAAAPPPRHASLMALRGKGMWVTDWSSDRLNAAALVDWARRNRLQALYVRTGSSHDGFYGGPLLARLVPLAHAAHIYVIAWDFATLSNPAADAMRAKAALALAVDGFSPDIEEAPEGTYLTDRRIAYYLSLVRRFAGNRPVVATVPRPTSLSLSGYPYRAEAPYVDAFAPMVYWSCTEPGSAVATAIATLRPLRPVVPIGQDYNMGADGGPYGLPSGLEIWRFVDVARRDGALGVSLYDLEAGGAAQLAALRIYPWQQILPGRAAQRGQVR
jgi:hypothetical protein